MEIVEYTLADGRSPFGAWFEGLDAVAAAKITVAIIRLAQGNISNVKGVGGGVLEQKIEFGPGYRVYFGRDGDKLIILVGGGTKQRQHRDIANALDRWRDYKTRKAGG